MRTRTRLTAIGVAGLLVVGLASGILAAAHPATHLPAAKQALEDFAARHRANAPKRDKAGDPGRPMAAQTDPPPETGLLGAVGAPMPGGRFTPTTAWAGWTTPTTYVQVYAGDAPDHAGKGLVLVVRRTGAHGRLDPTVPAVTTLVRPPAAGGPLRIVRVEGSGLVLVNPGGHEFVFRPASGAFGAGG
jgi:hypothetical protein